jgi:hypothetical protein
MATKSSVCAPVAGSIPDDVGQQGNANDLPPVDGSQMRAARLLAADIAMLYRAGIAVQ